MARQHPQSTQRHCRRQGLSLLFASAVGLLTSATRSEAFMSAPANARHLSGGGTTGGSHHSFGLSLRWSVATLPRQDRESRPELRISRKASLESVFAVEPAVMSVGAVLGALVIVLMWLLLRVWLPWVLLFLALLGLDASLGTVTGPFGPLIVVGIAIVLQPQPSVNGEPLEVGEIVAYHLDVPGEWFHAAVYLGRGSDLQFRPECVLQGFPFEAHKHYVIEYSGARRTSGFSQSSDSGRIFSGKGCQNIWITEMSSDKAWTHVTTNSRRYGSPYGAEETVSRALAWLQSDFGGYDVATNNCQHFAVYVKYGVKKMLLVDESKSTTARHIGAMTAMAILPPPLKLLAWLGAAANIVTADSGRIKMTKIAF